MQNVIESTPVTAELNQSVTPIDTIVEFMEDGEFKSRHFNLATHEGRVRLSKTVWWAMHQRIELRIRPAS